MQQLCNAQELFALPANRMLEQFGHEKWKRSFMLSDLLKILSLLPGQRALNLALLGRRRGGEFEVFLGGLLVVC